MVFDHWIKTGFMEVITPENFENIGGLEFVKNYFKKRVQAFLPGNKHMPKMRSCLLCGIPGTGKTLIGKALASLIGCDLITANVGQMKGGIVGETEKRTKLFWQTVKASGRVLVLLDEIEKMFSSSDTDSGASKSQLGSFLTNMNDHESDAIIFATANNLNSLPPEFLRMGRFDCIFFVDFPSLDERKNIIEIMNRKHHSCLDVSLAEQLENWTGAEIEQLAKDSHFEDVDFLVENIPTIYKTRKEDIKRLQENAKFYRKANNVDSKSITERVKPYNGKPMNAFVRNLN